MKRVLLKDAAKASLTTFNEARKHFGLQPIYNITDLVRGDITLLPDMPILSGLKEEDLNQGYYYSGPIFSKMEIPLPEEVTKVFSGPGLNIFCSLGSSGFPETLRLIIATLKEKEDFNIVCSTTTILDPKELGIPSDRFYACRFLPAHLVNEMADIAVIHGGQGTVQTAAWAGTPVVGIGFQAEQQANLDGLARSGMAVRIPIYDVTPKSLLKAVRKVTSEKFIDNASKIKAMVRATNGVEKTVQIMNDFILGRL
ncbi:glycosyltransferase [Echinicola salinicaeni]|uniref:glycosyltransferase n=1 Tax=Echinicola salinicaeni TaxID=2762757 RepID=UPI00164684A8|nr:nucleotide disphospho-sugar-binding domain-containing protein [Echinicola salinicaeni]